MSVDQSQQKLCDRYAATPLPAGDWVNTGFAAQTANLRPIHGLRHARTNDTTGWFIWCGDWSDAGDFFQPTHTTHVAQALPEIVPFLALPPGYRFLIDRDYEDVWFDHALLTV
jgi:hypothetical protein